MDVNASLSLILRGLKIREIKPKPTYILKNAVALNSPHTTALDLIYAYRHQRYRRTSLSKTVKSHSGGHLFCFANANMKNHFLTLHDDLPH